MSTTKYPDCECSAVYGPGLICGRPDCSQVIAAETALKEVLMSPVTTIERIREEGRFAYKNGLRQTDCRHTGIDYEFWQQGYLEAEKEDTMYAGSGAQREAATEAAIALKALNAALVRCNSLGISYELIRQEHEYIAEFTQVMKIYPK